MDRQIESQLAELAFDLAVQARYQGLVPPWCSVTHTMVLAATAWLAEVSRRQERDEVDP